MNLFKEFFKGEALEEAPHPFKYCGRYIDNTEVVNKKICEEELFDHINKQHPNIKFAIDREGKYNILPMLDMKLSRIDNSIKTDIYQKHPHMDQYLQWTSHHRVQQNLSIVRTLIHRADTLI